MAPINFTNDPAPDPGDTHSEAGTTWVYASNGTWTVVRAGLMTVLDTETFTSGTSYAIPTGAKLFVVECLGAGGGGASGQILVEELAEEPVVRTTEKP